MDRKLYFVNQCERKRDKRRVTNKEKEYINI